MDHTPSTTDQSKPFYPFSEPVFTSRAHVSPGTILSKTRKAAADSESAPNVGVHDNNASDSLLSIP